MVHVDNLNDALSLDLKIRSLQHHLQEFEANRGIPFEEFAERFVVARLEGYAYAYDVESDFWAWEKAEILLSK